MLREKFGYVLPTQPPVQGDSAAPKVCSPSYHEINQLQPHGLGEGVSISSLFEQFQLIWDVRSIEVLVWIVEVFWNVFVDHHRFDVMLLISFFNSFLNSCFIQQQWKLNFDSISGQDMDLQMVNVWGGWRKGGCTLSHRCSNKKKNCRICVFRYKRENFQSLTYLWLWSGEFVHIEGARKKPAFHSA